MTKPSLYGLILAGGQSRRMGRDKALLQQSGRSQLAHLHSILEPLTDGVFVSTRAEQQQEAERRRFRQIVDRYTGIGPVAGILSAMDEHTDSDWLVVACDLPNVDAPTVEYLIANASGNRPFTAYRSTRDDLPGTTVCNV